MFGAAAGLLAALFLKERARDADLAAADIKVALKLEGRGSNWRAPTSAFGTKRNLPTRTTNVRFLG
jgi:hypothetical protein